MRPAPPDDWMPMELIARMPLEPRHVARLRRRTRHDKKAIFSQTRDGQVRFDAAALIEPLRIDDLAWRDVDIIGADTVQNFQRIAAFDRILRKGGLVEEDAILHQLLGFVIGARKPVLPPV